MGYRLRKVLPYFTREQVPKKQSDNGDTDYRPGFDAKYDIYKIAGTVQQQ
jgi:hypothetical protein